jgi:type IV pilus assembly protein PilW
MHRQQGLSLVEIMVSLVAAMILTAGVIQIYSANKQTYRAAEASARLQENGRFAMELLGRDIRRGGYQGCAGSARTLVDTRNDTTGFLYNFSTPIQGFEATSNTAWTPTVDASINSPLGGSDIVTIRGAFDSEASITGSSNLSNCNSANLIIASATGFNAGDIAIAGNCARASIFQVTGFTAGSGTGTVAHATAGAAPGNATADLGTCYAGNGDLARMTTRSYYVRNATGGPALYRQDGTAAPEELVEGVEDMQILYGVDTDINPDGAANQFVRANDLSVAAWRNVASVRISLLLGSPEDNVTAARQTYSFNGTKVTADDHRLHRVFTTTIGLRNLLP